MGDGRFPGFARWVGTTVLLGTLLRHKKGKEKGEEKEKKKRRKVAKTTVNVAQVEAVGDQAAEQPLRQRHDEDLLESGGFGPTRCTCVLARKSNAKGGGLHR
ncbi:unnamed protein product [Hapterophycus canaliculatus]